MLTPKSQRGFTLIEVIIVLAISALLIVIVFAGRHTQLANQQFSNAVQKAKAYLEETKNEVQAGANVGGVGDGAYFAGGRTGIYGYMFQFQTTGNPNVDNTFIVSPLIYDLTTNQPWSGHSGVPVSLGSNSQTCLSNLGGKSYKLAWGTVYVATTPNPISRLIIRRNPVTGALESMIQHSNVDQPCVDTGSYGPGQPWQKVDGTAAADQLHFSDAAGHAGHVSVDNATALITVAYP